jgi:hypothetical protein
MHPSLRAPGSNRKARRALPVILSDLASLTNGDKKSKTLGRNQNNRKCQWIVQEDFRGKTSTRSGSLSFPQAMRINIDTRLKCSIARLAPTHGLSRHVILEHAAAIQPARTAIYPL